MSKFFNYRTLQELRDDATRLEAPIKFADQLAKIFHPVKLFDRKAGNSFAINPMEGCDGTLDGRPGDLTLRRYQRFAEGGAKLIWGEATAISEAARANSRQLWLKEENVDDFARLVAAARKRHRLRFGTDDDLIIGVQLTHSGRWSWQKPIIAVHDPLIDQVTYLDKKAGIRIPLDYPVISDDALENLEDDFARVARLAQQAGFDFIDLKQCHTYLLNELLGARTRAGRYGGSWENRTRFIRNVIEKIQVRAPGLWVASRVNIFDGIPWLPNRESQIGEPIRMDRPVENGFGLDLQNPFAIDFEEPLLLIALLRERGVGLLNLSMGSPYFNAHYGRPFEKAPPDMYVSPEHPMLGVARHFVVTARVKKAFPDIAIVGTGYSWLRQFFPYAAEANIRDGEVDFAGLGRGAIAYPNFAADLIEKGFLEKNKVCLAVSFCTTLMRRKDNALGQFPTGCVPRDPVYAQIYHELPD